MSLILSRYKLATFATCRRKYQLTYVAPVAWPPPPTPSKQMLARWRGEQFHLMVERYFRGFSPEMETIADEVLQAWWRTFLRKMPALPPHKKLIEYTLTIPILGYFLTGRFDLILVDGNKAHIFDWKTEAYPRTSEKLQADLQTQLYLAMAVEGGDVLTNGIPIDPDNVTITYWYVNAPTRSVQLRYSQRQHQQNWTQLEQRVALITAQFEQTDDIWALTENRQACEHCAYQLLCGRFTPTSIPQPNEPAMMAEIEPDIFSQTSIPL